MRPRSNANGQYVAGGAVQNAVRRGTQQQGEPVPPVASDDDGVDLCSRRDAVDLRFRSAEYQVTVVFGYVGVVAELIQARFRLFLNLVLYGRHVHGDVSAVDETQRFYDVNDVQVRIKQTRQLDRPLAHDARLLGEINGKQNTPVSTHAIALRRGCGDDTTQ